MTSTYRKRDAATEWHWGLLAFVLAVFLAIGSAAVIRGEWFAVAIALIGLGVFGRSAWTKFKLRRSGALPTEASSNEGYANSLSPRVVLLVILLGLLPPICVLVFSGSFSIFEAGSLWLVFALLWALGMLVAGVVVYLLRYVSHDVKRGIPDGKTPVNPLPCQTTSEQSSVGGMTVNERLFHFGLIDRFEDAVRAKDVQRVVQVLLLAQLSEAQALQTARAVMESAER